MVGHKFHECDNTPLGNKMSYAQVICVFLILAMCNGTLGKTSDDVESHADSTRHGRNRRQMSFGFGIPNLARYEEELRDPTGILNPLLKEIDPVLPKAPPEEPGKEGDPGKPSVLAEQSYSGNIFKKKLTVYDPTNGGTDLLGKNQDLKGTDIEDNLIERPCHCAVGGPEVREATYQGMKLKKIENINVVAVDKRGASHDPPKQYDVTGECTCWFAPSDGHSYRESVNSGVGILEKPGKKKK